MIALRSKIEAFELHEPDGAIRSSRSKELISFKYSQWKSRLAITIQSGSRTVALDLFGLNDDTKAIELFWQNFNNRELEELSSAFEFDLVKVINTNAEANLSTIIKGAEPIGQTFAKIATKLNAEDGGRYVVIFDYDFPDRTADGMVYVHGIWLADFSGDIEKKIRTILI